MCGNLERCLVNREFEDEKEGYFVSLDPSIRVENRGFYALLHPWKMAIKRNGWAVSQLRNPAITPQYSPGMRTHWPWRQLGAKVAPDIALLTEDDTGGASLAPEWRHGGATINSQNLWRQRGASLAPSWRQRCDGPEIFSRHHPFLHLPPVFRRRS